jgi:hypothetical protein
LTNKSKAAGSNDYVDYGIRMAALSPKLAAKANFTYMRGTDWYATNYDDKTVGRDRNHVNMMVSMFMVMKLLQIKKELLLDFLGAEPLRLNMQLLIISS